MSTSEHLEKAEKDLFELSDMELAIRCAARILGWPVMTRDQGPPRPSYPCLTVPKYSEDRLLVHRSYRHTPEPWEPWKDWAAIGDIVDALTDRPVDSFDVRIDLGKGCASVFVRDGHSMGWEGHVTNTPGRAVMIAGLLAVEGEWQDV